MVEKTPALKESLFSPKLIGAFGEAIQSAYSPFDRTGFSAQVFDDKWAGRELKARMRHVTETLHKFLPTPYRSALQVLQRAAPRFPAGSFVAMVPSDYVSLYGLDDFEVSIPALELFTQRVSAEFAVRPFIIRYPQRMMTQMLKWADHPSFHVRRLATEGCRPRLPWGVSLPDLKKDPTPILPILDKLYCDPAETVRRSVANNLNDIAKDNPEVVLKTLKRWQDGGKSAELDWIIRQALRTLIKAGDPSALALIGVGTQVQVKVRALKVSPTRIPMHGSVTFSFEIESLADEPQDVVIDYVLHLARARGKMGTKVFKLARRTLKPREVAQISRVHSFAPITTRRYYPGLHAVQPQINGQLHDRVEFIVEGSETGSK